MPCVSGSLVSWHGSKLYSFYVCTCMQHSSTCHSFTDGHMCCFHTLTIVSNATVNIDTWTSMWVSREEKWTLAHLGKMLPEPMWRRIQWKCLMSHWKLLVSTHTCVSTQVLDTSSLCQARQLSKESSWCESLLNETVWRKSTRASWIILCILCAMAPVLRQEGHKVLPS